MTTSSQISTMDHVTAFIDSHAKDDSYASNKDMLCPIIERVGGKEVFFATYMEKMREQSKTNSVSLNFYYPYADEDNLKFWDAHRDNIIAGFQHHVDMLGYDCAASMLSQIFDDTNYSINQIAAALNEKPCDYTNSSPARKQICSWLSLAAISDAYTDFVGYMDGIEATQA